MGKRGFQPYMSAVSFSRLLALSSAFLAAWVAAGSAGLLAHPLRHVLAVFFLGLAAVAGWSSRRGPPPPWRNTVLFLLNLFLSLLALSSSLPSVNILGPALTLAGLSYLFSGRGGILFSLGSRAVILFALFRILVTSFPAFWMVLDVFAGLLGHLSIRTLNVGPTLAGTDFLFLSLAFLLILFLHFRGSAQGLGWAFAEALLLLFVLHVLYLNLVGWACGWIGEGQEAVSALSPRASDAGEALAAEKKLWAARWKSVLPWNLPLLAAFPPLFVLSAFLLWLRRTGTEEKAITGRGENPGPEPEPIPVAPGRTGVGRKGWQSARYGKGGFLLAFLIVLVSILFAALATLFPAPGSPRGKKIVIYEKGFLNWLKPQHGEYGRLSVGMYGQLPAFLESLGARCLVSERLSPADLEGAKVLVLIYPNEPWEEGQVERIRAFARSGGSLLIWGEHTIREKDVPLEKGGNRFNEVLEGTGIKVHFDSTMMEVGGWLHAYQPFAHPATLGLADDRNQFGVVVGASLELSWPAFPVLAGKFGWGDAGDEKNGASMMGNRLYDPGERAGDLILAAEQPYGKGRLVVFGDTSSLTNGITPISHLFTSRLFAYLAGPGPGSHPVWRGFVGLACFLALGLFLVAGRDLGLPLAGALSLSAALALGVAWTHRRHESLPDGRLKQPNNLALIDVSHLEAYSGESWRDEGFGGLELTLMRDGFLALEMPDFSPHFLDGAAILFSLAPAKPYSAKERAAIRSFVEKGGIWICTAGYDDEPPVRQILADFGFWIGKDPFDPGPREPMPFGHFKAPFLNLDGTYHYVRFHAAWPVGPSGPGEKVIAYGPRDQAAIVMRRVGQGKAVLVGDTAFVMNKNLEREDGTPFEGMRENAVFWRYFLTVLRDQEPWYPSPPAPQGDPGPAAAPAEKKEAP